MFNEPTPICLRRWINVQCRQRCRRWRQSNSSNAANTTRSECTLRRDTNNHVPWHRIQYDIVSERTQSWHTRRGWSRSESILPVGRNEMFAGSEIFPLLDVHADLHWRLPQTVASVSIGVRENSRRLCTNHAKVQFPMARADGVRQIPRESGKR